MKGNYMKGNTFCLSNYIFPGGTGGRLIGGGFSQAKILLEGGDCGNL